MKALLSVVICCMLLASCQKGKPYLYFQFNIVKGPQGKSTVVGAPGIKFTAQNDTLAIKKGYQMFASIEKKFRDSIDSKQQPKLVPLLFTVNDQHEHGIKLDTAIQAMFRREAEKEVGLVKRKSGF